METRELHNLGMGKKCTREAHGNRGLGTPTQSVETRELHRLLIPERKEKKKKKTLHTPPPKRKRKPFTRHLRNKKENPSHTTSETKKKKKRSGVGQPRGKKRCALGRHISKQQKAGLGHPSPQRPHGDSGAPQPGDGGEKNPSHLHLQNQTQWWWSRGRSGVCTREAHKSRQQKAGLVHPSPQGLMETRELHNLGVEKTVHSGGTQGTHPVRGDSGAPPPADPRKERKKKKTLHTPPPKQKRKPFTHHLRNEKENPSHAT